MYASPDPIRFVLDLPQRGEPGAAFYYNSGASQLLTGILEKAVGMRTEDWARTRLFDPLGIADYAWDTTRSGMAVGAGGLRLSAASLAKIGVLVARGGLWEGRRIVGEAWIEESTGVRVPTPRGLAGRHGYGYQWWMNPASGFSGRGYGGQYLFVHPEEGIVAVFLGMVPSKDFFKPEDIFERVIVPVLRSRKDA